MLARNDEARSQMAQAFAQAMADQKRGELHNAVLEYERALEAGKGLELTTDDRCLLSRCHYRLGMILQQQYDERTIIDLPWLSSELPLIVDHFARAAQILSEIPGDERTDDHLLDMSLIFESWAMISYKHKKWEATIEYAQQAQTIWEDVAKRRPADNAYHRRAGAYYLAGEACRQMGQWNVASQYFHKALAQWGNMSRNPEGSDHKNEDNELRQQAACFHGAGQVLNKMGEQDAARAYFLSEVNATSRVRQITGADFKRILDAYRELKNMCPEHDSEREVFDFAVNVFGNSFFGGGASSDKLNRVCYLYSSTSKWQTNRINESLPALLALIANFCRHEEFPESPLKHYLRKDENLAQLRNRINLLKEIKPNVLEDALCDFQARLHRLEQRDEQLRHEIAELSHKLDMLLDKEKSEPASPVSLASAPTLFQEGQRKARKSRTKQDKDSTAVVSMKKHA